MTTGRKPKPTALKRLAGNPGRRPLNDREPQLARAIPACPRTLSAGAKRQWKYLAIRLYNIGVLTEIDQSVLAALCAEWDTWQKAKAQLAKHGMLSLTAGGSFKPSPYITISNQAMANILRLLAELGMTPSSRTRVKAANMQQMSLADLLFEKASEKTGTGGPR
jgi:P27 family predicted phage terminase small subunit